MASAQSEESGGTRRPPVPGKPGRKPVIPIPKQWNIPARADHVGTVLGFLEQKNQIEWKRLLHAKTLEDVRKAFLKAEGSHDLRTLWDFTEGGGLILDWVRERKWPKFESQARIRHLAKSIGAPSLAGRGKISLRRSRDLCSEKAARLPGRQRVKGTILRVEPYIECSCRYKGPAEDQKCPRCGAEITSEHRQLLFA